MSTTILQVRDIDVAVLDVLRQRAEAKGLSLSGYVRNLLAEEAALPSPDELMTRIASREPVDVTSDDVRDMVDGGGR
jgi:hypothetical protein